ncbi:MAG: hypothetical protein KatS3mg077_0873 [Candidatus Binatia bacterium]|nr:MAG: hypothetical protein KatS3mg077_0873 [Candidatus Binatia bacterium]
MKPTRGAARFSFVWWATLAAALTACNAPLPEPDSPGARLYASRCNTCHRLHAPSALTFEMWKMKVASMQGEMVRRGLPPLTREERDLLLDYLRRHSQGAKSGISEVKG